MTENDFNEEFAAFLENQTGGKTDRFARESWAVGAPVSYYDEKYCTDPDHHVILEYENGRIELVYGEYNPQIKGFEMHVERVINEGLDSIEGQAT